MSMNFKDWLLQADESELVKVASSLKSSFQAYTTEAMVKFAEEMGVAAPKVNDMPPADLGKTISKNDLTDALEEAILTNNPKALAQVIGGVAQAGGEEAAENAISVARTILQDALVGGKLDKDQITVLAQAFAAIEG